MDIFTKKAEEIVSDWQKGEPLLEEPRRVAPLLIAITEALDKAYELGRMDKQTSES